jgi:hypothetical protein
MKERSWAETQPSNSILGLKHDIGIKDHVGVRVSERQEKELNCTILKDRLRINFFLGKLVQIERAMKARGWVYEDGPPPL